MTVNIDRRQLMALGTFGLGAMSMPASAALTGAKGFTHGVASGEPSEFSILLWTRYVADGDTKLTVELSEQLDFGRTSAALDVTAQASRDHIAKINVESLEANKWYFYRFIAPDGTKSATGRTRTGLPKSSIWACSVVPICPSDISMLMPMPRRVMIST